MAPCPEVVGYDKVNSVIFFDFFCLVLLYLDISCLIGLLFILISFFCGFVVCVCVVVVVLKREGERT